MRFFVLAPIRDLLVGAIVVAILGFLLFVPLMIVAMILAIGALCIQVPKSFVDPSASLSEKIAASVVVATVAFPIFAILSCIIIHQI